MTHRLPIDEHLDAIEAAVRTRGMVVLLAPPGAGKTTRVPAMLRDRLGKAVVCTQPRRLAARLAAERVAWECGGRIGDEIGYEVRFERKVSEATRVRFVTEGIALRKWPWKGLDDDILVLDEFHERHVEGDVLLALAAQRRREGRGPALVVMSATLDPGPIAAYLGDAPIVVSEGRTHPVDIEYLDGAAGEVQVLVSRAVRRLLQEGLSGDVLVFLPGAAEIHRCRKKLEDYAAHHELFLCTLHGSMSAAEQKATLAPQSRRKIILSTNVAETSVTIEGVRVVIDAGTARIASHSPWTGLPSLDVAPVSRASAIQRAGRAGRTAPGRCLRLFSQHDFDSRREYETPEIARADLTELALKLADADLALRDLTWFEAPPPALVESAEALLQRLGAVHDGRITELGRSMNRLPLHPRLSRVVLEADRHGQGSAACLVAALLGERPIRLARRSGQPAEIVSESDVLDDLELMEELRAASFRGGVARGAGVDLMTARAVDRAARQIEQSLPGKGSSEPLEDSVLLRALLSGFSDRVARRVDADRLRLAFGGMVGLSRASAVTQSDFVLALEVESRGQGGQRSARVLTASAIEPEWLLELDDIEERDRYELDRERQRVVRRSGIYYGELAIDEEVIFDTSRMDADRMREVLEAAAREEGLENLVDREALSALRARLGFVQSTAPDSLSRAWDDVAILAALFAHAPDTTTLAALRAVDVASAVIWQLSAEERAIVERLAPSTISLPGRKRVPVHYELDRPPWIESRLQDFFGLREGPRVAAGKVPLTLHLLAPNHRAVQVTTDLAGFWTRHYPALRKQLMRRYPRHAWPENP